MDEYWEVERESHDPFSKKPTERVRINYTVLLDEFTLGVVAPITDDENIAFEERKDYAGDNTPDQDFRRAVAEGAERFLREKQKQASNIIEFPGLDVHRKRR